MKNKKSILLSTILILSIAMPIFALQTANAESTMKTYAFIGAMPNPAGVNQDVLLHIGISQALQNAADGWEDLTVTVTHPDNHTETLGPFRTDSTGGTGSVYVPTMVGNYTFQTHFPEQIVPSAVSGFGGTSLPVPAGTVMQASDSEILTLVVLEQPLGSYEATPLPTEFWTRPINSQFRDWSTIAGNWIGYARYDAPFVPENDGPETGHILWTKPLAMGGLAGGEMGEHSFEDGDAYEGFFASSVIIGGNLYYNRFNANGGTRVEQEVVAVNMRTGEELWVRNWNNTRLSFGQVFYWDSWNYHGVFDYLWSTSGTTWNAYDAETGRWEYQIYNVPSGTQVRGDKGEIYIYTINTANGWMTQWNSSRVVQPQTSGGSGDGSWIRNGLGTAFNGSEGYDWNVTIPTGLTGSIVGYTVGDKAIGVDVQPSGVKTWALDLRDRREGELLYQRSWNAPSSWVDGNVTIAFRRISMEDNVFVVWVKETRQWWGFNAETGQKIWGPTEPEPYLNIYASSRDTIAYGKLITVGYSGVASAYDLKNGSLIWTFEARDPLNEILWGNNWPLYMGFVTDGKIYLHTTEHSSVDPKPRGAQFYCLDIETGKEIFTINIRGHHWGESPLIGDSTIAMYNTYDQLIYAMSKGPSEITVTAPNAGVPLGSSVIISGSVTDISPGTSDYSITSRFPQGVPAVSDQSMSQWMQYVYMQFAKPTNVTGVEVMLSTLDPNGNYIEIGTTTTDSSGCYSYQWVPEIPGKYTVIATFQGSNAYYPSSSQAAIGVDEQIQPTPTETQDAATMPPFELYFVISTIAIIATVVVIGLLMLRKRP
jgi:outer membrane protein assembly factor BamB